MEDLLETAQFENDDIDEDNDLCIRAFGAAGSDGGDFDMIWTVFSGGDGGDGGVAQTITTYSEISSQYTDLYYLLGHNGSSTVVTSVDFSSSTDIDVDGVIVDAGGGGGRGEGGDTEGGAGSYAKGATVTSEWCNDDYYTTNSSSYGNVTFIFSAEDED